MLNIFSNPSVVITYIIILLTAFPVHEFAHAWVADQFGDDTPRVNGRLTLNPFAHLDPIGTIMMIAGGFWMGKTGADQPICPAAALVSCTHAGLAGRAYVKFFDGNYGCHLFPSGTGFNRMISINRQEPFFQTIATFLYTFIEINLLLMLFNLIPLFPLDGEKVIAIFFTSCRSAFFG